VSRPGSRRHHQKFCETEGWELVRDARGRSVGHHITYELPLADGRILRTRVSRPANADTYGPRLWSEILGSSQLAVTEDQFWSCVDDGIKPIRPGQQTPVPAEALPADLVYALITKLRVPEGEVAAMTLQQAMDMMNEYWSKPKP
jgi:hypothetical protein